MSVELLQMKGEYDDKLRWNEWFRDERNPYNKINLCRADHWIAIQMLAQSEKAQAPEKEVSLLICTNCFAQKSPPEDLRVFKNCHGNAMRGVKFIDHQSAEQVMVLNDTFALRIYLRCSLLY